MSQPLVSFTPPPPIRSALLLAPPDSVPAVDELETIQAELNALKQRALDRAKKADDDLRTIESAMKKMREKVKGKAKAVAKVKREPSYTPSLDNEDIHYVQPTAPSTATSPVPPASAGATNTQAFSKAPSEQRKAKKKEKDKKRKRELDDSDAEEAQRPRKFSPLPPPKEPFHHKPSKLGTSSITKFPSGPDWNLPEPHPLLPPKPPHQQPPVAGPSKPIQVTEDFSKLKAPQQTTIATFYSFIEPWLRSIREEDVGLLEWTADEVEPYVIPPLGKHYMDIWEEEDMTFYGGIPHLLDFTSRRAGMSRAGPSTITVPKWDPSTITDADATTDKGNGPVAERLVSAMLQQLTEKSVWMAIKEAEDAYETRPPDPSANRAINREKATVAELEERVREAARRAGLLQTEPEFAASHDDAITAALRQAQKQLRSVVAINKARKARLVDIAKDRLAYQEYIELRDSIDKNINAMFAKLQKKDKPKLAKKKKKGDTGSDAVIVSNGAGAPLPNPATHGLTIDDEGKLFVPDALRNFVDIRKQWVSTIGAAFEEKQKEYPGRIYNTPPSSVFDGIEEAVRVELESLRVSSFPSLQRKKPRTDAGTDKVTVDDSQAANAS